MALVAKYDYKDKDGNILFSKSRFEPGPDGKKKTFAIEGLNEDTERVLYNLPEAVASDVVFFVEGESCVECLRDMGICAVTIFSGSSSSWSSSYSRILKDKEIYLIPDNDEPGKHFAETVSAGLAGYAKFVKVINLPVGPKGDIVDYVKAGHTKQDLELLISKASEEKPITKKIEQETKLREPSADQSESLVLGAVMNGTHPIEDLEDLTTNDFHNQAHKTILNAIRSLNDEIGISDTKAVAQYLDEKGRIQDIGGITYLLDMVGDLPSVFNLEAHVEAIKEKTFSRDLLKSLNEASNRLICGESADRIHEELVSKSGKIATSKKTLQTVSVSDIAGNIDDLLKPREQGITVDPLNEIFQTFGGLLKGDLITLSARSGHGKSSLAYQISSYAAVKYGHAVDFLSYEIDAESCLIKMVTQTARLNYMDVLRGSMSDEDKETFRKMAAHFKKSNLRISDKNFWSLSRLRSHLKNRRAIGDSCRVIIVDYVQMANMGGRPDRRDLEISRYIDGLKELALEFKLTIVMLSQMNKSGDAGGSTISSLKDSSGFENNSSVVILLEQDLLNDDPESEYRESVLKIAKNRIGATGSYKIRFLKRSARFEM
jgi:replicative DNA helicase